MKIRNKILLLFSIAVLALGLIAVFFYHNINKLNDSMAYANHTRELVKQLDDHLLIMQDAEIGQRGFVITGKESFLERYNIAVNEFKISTIKLRNLAEDKNNPKQQQRLETLQKLSELRMTFIKKNIKTRREKGFDAAQKMASTEIGKKLTDSLGKTLNELRNQEEQSFKDNIKIANESSQFVLKFIISGGILSMVIVLVSLFWLNRNLRTRKQLEKELKNNRDQIQTIFKNAPDAIIVIDHESKIMRWNPKAETLFGWNEKEVLGNLLHEFIVPHRFRVAHIKGMQHFLATGNGPVLNKTIEITALNKRGTEFSIALFIAPTLINGTYFFLAFLRDTTGQKKFENELKTAKELAEKLGGFKDQFLTNMSHEIRTPLNAVIGFTDLLAQTKLDNIQHDYVDNVQMAGENLLLIINDILDLSKMESGNFIIEALPFNLQKTLKHVYNLLKEKVAKNVEFNLFLDADLPEIVVGDSGRLNQILVNLTGNALKFTEKGEVTISVKKVDEKVDQYSLKFSVRDTGIGIPQDRLESIFERFTQAEDSTTRRFGGTGLGLNIVKQLVELQKAEIEVKSKLGRGSEFSFALIYKKANHTEIAIAALTEDNFGKLKILLCEDNVLNQKLVKTVIHNFGFELDIAENGEKGIDFLLKNKYDLVLMDLQMPIKDGYQTTKYIRNEMNSTIPIIAMTAHSLVGEQQRCYDIGMDAYVPKPFKQAALLEAIKIVMNKNCIPVQNIRVDFSFLNEMSGGNKNFKQEMITLFIEKIPTEVAHLEEAIRSDDKDTVKKLAHKMKSSLEIFMLNDLINALTIIEENAKMSRFTNETLENFNILHCGIIEVIKSLEELGS